MIEKKNSIYKNTEAMNKGLADSGYEPGKNGIQSVEYENTDFLVNKSKNEQNHVYRDADGMIRAKIDGAYIDGVTYTKFSGLNREHTIYMSPHATVRGFNVTFNHELIHVYHFNNYTKEYSADSEYVALMYTKSYFPTVVNPYPLGRSVYKLLVVRRRRTLKRFFVYGFFF